ncbi:hypothetical protein [Methanosarcina horonobensis]|nr:hypothetical protein [Methanosarcina horonobensis]
MTDKVHLRTPVKTYDNGGWVDVELIITDSDLVIGKKKHLPQGNRRPGRY